MAIEKKARRIKDARGEEHTYVITEFGAEEGFDLAMELWGMAGDALGAMAGALGSGNAPAALGFAFQRLAQELQRHGGVKMMKRLLKDCVRDQRLFSDAKAPTDTTWTWDVAYKANYGEAIQAVAFVLEVNFASFFAGFGALPLAERLKALLKEGVQPSEN